MSDSFNDFIDKNRQPWTDVSPVTFSMEELKKAFEKARADMGKSPDMSRAILFVPQDEYINMIQNMPIEPLEFPEELKSQFRPFFDYGVKVMSIPSCLYRADYSGVETRVMSDMAERAKFEERARLRELPPKELSFWQASVCVVVVGWILSSLAGIL